MDKKILYLSIVLISLVLISLFFLSFNKFRLKEDMNEDELKKYLSKKQVENSFGLNMIANKELRCSFSPDSEKREYNTCELIVELENTNDFNIFLDSRKKFKLDFNKKNIKKESNKLKIEYYYSTEFKIISEVNINQSCVKKERKEQNIMKECLINTTFYKSGETYILEDNYSTFPLLRNKPFNKTNIYELNYSCVSINNKLIEKKCSYLEHEREWINWTLSDSLSEIKDNSLIAIKSVFKIKKYESNFYNFSFIDSVKKEYKLDPDISECGDITSSGTYTLTSDLDCVNDGIQIVFNDVILDCGGHTINYSSSGDACDRGIYISHANNVTVKNCIIKQTNITGEDGRHGIYNYLSSNISILNNSIYLYGNSSNGINNKGSSATISENNRLIDNTIYVNSENDETGIKISTYTKNYTVFGNKIFLESSDKVSIYGISISGLRDFNISDNIIEGIFNNGINVYSDVDNVTINNNTINGTSEGNSIAMYIGYSITNINISNNFISQKGSVNYSYSIYFSENSVNINFTNNTVADGILRAYSPVAMEYNKLGRISAIYPLIMMELGSEYSNISDNDIYISYGGGDAISIYSNDVLLENNNITTTSGSSIVVLNALRTKITNNNITSSASAIYLDAHSDSTNITENNILSKTSSNSCVCAIDSKYLKVNNNFINSSYNGLYLFAVDHSDILNNIIEGKGYSLSLDTSDNNSLYNSTIMASDSSELSLAIVNSNNNRVINFSINSSSGGADGLYMSSNSLGNIIENGIIDTYSGSNAFGIYLYTPNENNLTNLTVTTHGGDGSPGYGVGSASLLMRSSDKTNIIDSVFNAINSDDIQIRGTEAYSINLINTTFNEVVFHATENTTGIKKYWYFSPQVNFSHNGTAVYEANVSAYNISGEIQKSELTDENGQTSIFSLIEYIQNGLSKIDYTNYTINATLTGWSTTSRIFNLTTNYLNQQFNIKDLINPLIDYGILTKEDNSLISLDNIYVDVSLTESNFENMYYYLYNETIPTENLVAYLNFDRNLSTQPDLSKNGYDGTVDGATWNASGKMGGKINLDGNNHSVIMGYYPSIGSVLNFSYGAWVNPISYKSGTDREDQMIIFGGRHGDDDTLSIEDGGRILFRRDDPELKATGKAKLDEWTHVFVTYSYTNSSYVESKIYINGIINASQITEEYGFGVNKPHWVGWESRFHNSFNGSIDEVMIFNKSLSDSEVSNIYKRSLVNHTIYQTEELNINWTGLIDNDYHYFVDILDTIERYNSTNIRRISLDLTSPTLNITSPTNNTNSTNSNLIINYTTSDTNLDSCWWSNNSGATNQTTDKSIHYDSLSSNFYAGEDQYVTSSLPPINSLPPDGDTEANSGDYEDLESNDGSYWQSSPQDRDGYQYFKFYIDNSKEYEELKIFWNGKQIDTASNQKLYFYMWNYSSTEWVNLDSYGCSEVTNYGIENDKTCSISSYNNHFINTNGEVSFIVYAHITGTSGSAQQMHTDYLNLTAKPVKDCYNITGQTWIEGETTIWLWANDSSSNENKTDVKFTIDTTPPITTATPTSPPEGAGYTWGTWTNQNVKVTLSAVDTGIGYNNLAYPLYCTDQANTCVPNTYISSGATISTEGVSYIRFYSNDTINNKETTQSKEIKIDSTSPTIDTIPADDLISYGNNWDGVDFDSSDSASGIGSYSVNDTRFTINSTGFLDDTSILGADIYLINVSINDTLGNTNSTLYNLTINKAILSASLNSDLGWTINETQEVVINLSESNSGDGDVTYIIYRDSVSKTTGETWTPAYGTYTYILNSTGGANYTSNSSISTQTLTVNDIIFPIPIITYPIATNYSTISTLNYTYIETNCDKAWVGDGTTNYSALACGTNFTGLVSAEGSNTWTLYINDTSGNQNSTSVAFIKDTTNPNIQITVPSNNTNSSNNQLIINYTTSDTNLDSCWWSNNSGATNNTLTNCQTNITGQTWIEGQTTIYIYDNDTFGNQNKTDVTFTIDSISPELSITLPEDTHSYSTNTINLNYTTSDATIGLDKCWYQNDSGSNITITCGTNTTISQSSDGTYTIYMWANDTLGNEARDLHTYTISTLAPAISLINPTNTEILNTTSIIFNYTSIDSNGVDTCQLWGNWTGWHLNLSDSHSGDTSVDEIEGNFYQSISDGYYKWNIWCNDTNPTSDFSSTNFTFRIDSTFPLIEFDTLTPTNNTNSTSTNIYIDITYSESNLDTITFALYDSTGLINQTSFTTPTYNINFTNLPDEIYTYNVTINDTAGNINYTKTRTRRLDDTKPIITISKPLSQNYGTTSMTLNHTTTDNLIGLDECWYYIYFTNGTLSKSTETLLSCQNDTFELPSGDNDYTLTLLAKDLLGNVQTSSVTFGIRTESPVVVLSPINDTHTNIITNNYFNFTTSTNSDNISACQLWGSWNGWHLNQTINNPTENIEINFSPLTLSEGEYIWNVNCSDNFDNSEWALNNHSFIVDLTNPFINITNIKTTKGSQTIDFNNSMVDIHETSCKYSIFDSDGNIDGINENISISCNAENSATSTSYGTFTLTIYATDKAKNENSSSLNFTTESKTIITGGGGGISVINGILQSILTTNYSITSSNMQKTMDIALAKDSIRPRKRELLLINKAREPVEITLECDTTNTSSTSNGDICNYVEFSNQTMILSPNEEVRTEVILLVSTPKNSSWGDEYPFNILAVRYFGEDSSTYAKLSITTRVSFFSTIFYKWSDVNIFQDEEVPDKDKRAYPVAPISIFLSLIPATLLFFLFRKWDIIIVGFLSSVIVFGVSFVFLGIVL